MAQHLPFFQSQIGHMGVEKMYCELVRDNRQIIYAIGKEQVLEFIELLRKDKNPDCIDFLAVLCEAEKGPIPNNQDMVADALLRKQSGKSTVPVFLTEFEGNVVVVNTENGRGEWVPLVDFVQSAMDEDDSTSTKEFLYLQKQFNLFNMLCAGRNENCIQVCAEHTAGRYLPDAS